MRRLAALSLAALGASLLVPVAASVASAAPRRAVLPYTVQNLHYESPVFHLTPGQNTIHTDLLPVAIGGVAMRPAVPGWITGITPNLIYTDGTVPPVETIHLHHAVWLNVSRLDWTAPGFPERFFATGEEKTAMSLPAPYGYRYDPNDTWALNHMLHVLDDQSHDVRLTWDLTFVPASTAGTRIKEAFPLWMDVQNGSSYPVFDVAAGSGAAGVYTYPTDATDPYGGGAPKNEYTIPVRGALIQTGGHLHPGGLHTDLSLRRTMRSGVVRNAHLFRSEAQYFEPAGPVSWDVAMTVTPPTWKVGVRVGDVLSTTATYDTSRWSTYEDMGIMVTWFAPYRGGRSAFGRIPVDVPGVTTHGHLAENDNHGGGYDPGFSDASALPGVGAPIVSSIPTIDITNFEYEPGDLDFATQIPTVAAGTGLRFRNLDAPSYGDGIWHTITTCALPCNGSTGIAYPLSDASVQLDSGQLGNYGPPTAGRRTWTTPTDLAPGDYSYFCRVHPFMRGAFRVTPN
ncbi:MAG: hypothetical protein ACKOZL_09840 [Actinomycetes bacterium]